MSANRSAPPALRHGVHTPKAHNARAIRPARLRAIPHNTDKARRGNRRRKDQGTKPNRRASQLLDDGRSNPEIDSCQDRLALKPDRRARLEARLIAFRIETQAERAPIMIADCTLGLPGRE